MRLTLLAALELAATPERRRAAPRLTLPLVALVIAVVYFTWVALLGLRIVILSSLEPTITPADWAAFGGLLMLVLLVLLVLDYRKARDRAFEEAEAPAAADTVPTPVFGERSVPDELVVTAETWQGRRVLEYSRPPKSEHGAAVYAKCTIPVDAQLVLRVEDLVAESA